MYKVMVIGDARATYVGSLEECTEFLKLNSSRMRLVKTEGKIFYTERK